MKAFEYRLRNTQRDVPSFVARTSFSNHKHTWLILEKLTDFIGAQIPHLSDFRNGIVPLDMH
jgi:hypothetical protein